MRISNVRRSDSGNYSCVAGNVLGERRKSVSINVRYSGKLVIYLLVFSHLSTR